MHAIQYLGGGTGVIALITGLFVATTARRYAALLLLGPFPPTTITAAVESII